MSTRYEWFDATSTTPVYRAPGTDVDDGAPTTEETADEYAVDRGAIVLYADEAAVLHGAPDELRDLLTRALAALPPGSNPHTFDKFPTARIDLGDGKVTGSVVISYVGQEGAVFIGTEGAHVNDDNPGIEYGGRGYIGRVWVYRDGEGAWQVDSDNSWNRGMNFTSRDNWSDAGKLAERMITARLLAAMAEHFDPELAREGERVWAEREAQAAWKAAQEAHQAAQAAQQALRAAEAKLAALRD